MNYILENTGAETISYIAYSMGSMQLFYDLATAGEDDSLFESTKKIEKLLAMAPCPYTARTAGLTLEGAREYILEREEIIDE